MKLLSVSQKLIVIVVTACLISAAQAQQPDDVKHVEACVEMNYYTREETAHVVFDVDALSPSGEMRAKATLRRPNGKDTVAEAVVASGVARLKLPIAELPVGTYSVALSLSVAGDVVWKGQDTLIKRPLAPDGVRVVQVDRYRRVLVVDGKPWFPMGVFGIYSEHLSEAANAGFNVTQRWKGATTIHRYQRTKAWDDPANRAAVRDYLDEVHRAGMYAIESPVKLVEEAMYVKFRDKEFHSKYPVVNSEITPGVVKHSRHHPAVIGYYSYDEPDNFYPTQPDHPKHLLMQTGVERWYDIVHQLDPYHPVMTLFAVDLKKIQDWKAWDVAMRDFYIDTDEHMSRVYDTALKSVEVAWRLRTPFVYTPLFEKSSGRPVPLSPAEQRAQTYLSLAADVKGLFYWDWPAAYAPNWEMLKQLAGEVNQLASVLLERAPRQSVKYESPDTERSLKLLVKNHNGKTYLIAVNAEPAPLDVTFRLPQNYRDQATVLFEDRTAIVQRGKMIERFEPYGRHVYVFDDACWKAGAELSLAITIGDENTMPDPKFPDSDANLLVNSSFEHDYARLPGWPFAWHPSDTVMESGVTDARKGGRWAVTEDESHHGRRSMRLIKSAPGIGNSNDAFNLATTPAVEQRVKFPAAGKYTFSAWMKADKPARTWMMVGWEKLVPIELDTDWKRYEITVNRGSAGNSFVRIYLVQQGKLWVDDVVLRLRSQGK